MHTPTFEILVPFMSLNATVKNKRYYVQSDNDEDRYLAVDGRSYKVGF
jgi:hypothetical protein